jgi:DNA-binding CsgD family transcriptional regulator
MCLHRDRSSPPFTAGEAAFLAQLTPHLAEGLRKALLISGMTRPTLPDEPGLLLLAEDLSLAAITPAAERWLAEVATVDWPRTQQALSYAVAAAARLQALERASDMQPNLLPRVRLRTASGYWLVLHASRLSGSSAGGQIAVIVEAARPAEVAPLIVQAYDLTKRESEILQLVVQGHSTAEIAATLHISTNTVQDHLKAIFEKVGVRSRRELAGQLFAQQYQPRIALGRDLDANGWFT